MGNLYNDLQPAIQKFSEIFCVSTEYIQEHFMEYVLQYGKYYLMKNTLEEVIAIVLCSICVQIAILIWESERGEIKKSIKILVFIIPIIVYLLAVMITYFANPTIYSIEKVIELLA